MWRIVQLSAFVTIPGRRLGGKIVNITDIRIRKVHVEGKLKATVSVTFDDEFVVHDMKIIEGQNGIFIAMPSRRTPDGEFKDIAHPVNSTARATLQTLVLGKYFEMQENEPSPAEEYGQRMGVIQNAPGQQRLPEQERNQV